MIDTEFIYKYEQQHKNTAIWRLVLRLETANIAEEQIALCRILSDAKYLDHCNERENLADLEGAYNIVLSLCNRTRGDVQAEAFTTCINLKIALQDAKAELADQEALRWFYRY